MPLSIILNFRRPAISSVVLIWLTMAARVQSAPPRSLDDRIVIELIAAEPEIVTPTGIAVDPRGRIYCIESHTHFRPEGYIGPPADRIRVFEDSDGDGSVERISTFFEGTKATMGLAFDAKFDWLYVVARSEMFRIRDTNGDGVSDERESLVRLETTGEYPHNGLNGCAFDAQGRVYFGQGENLGVEWTVIGTDGATIAGGDGGRVYRCNADGTGLRQIAQGCWNPFGQCFDRFGQLFVVDNDPDSRPPCRLLHVVPDADFGYRFSNGRKGLHPFSAWNGDLPGTLPMVAGTGEAPSNVLAYEADNLPEEYRGKLLVPSWGDHRIDSFALEQVGASWRSAFKPVIVGDEDFRPVGIATAPDGSLVVSDWVDKSYELHGKGRIWRVRAKEKPSINSTEQRAAQELNFDDAAHSRRLLDAATDVREKALIAREAPFDQATLLALAGDVHDSLVRAEALRRLELSAESAAPIFAACKSSDPFLAQAARRPLIAARRYLWPPDWKPADASLRLTYLLVAKESQASPDDETMRSWLQDSDEAIRMTAVRWVGEARWERFRPELTAALARSGQSPRAFASVLAALERLDGVQREVSDEDAGETYVARLVADPQLDLEVLERAVGMLSPEDKALSADVLGRLFASGDPSARMAAIRVWSDRAREDDQARLGEIARNASSSTEERAVAIAGIRPRDEPVVTWLIDVACGENRSLAVEALRSLRGALLNEALRERVREVEQRDEALAELARLLLKPPLAAESTSDVDLNAWQSRLEGPADPAAGERVFFHPQGPGCFKCHQVAGRGASVGPDLTTTGRQLDRRRLIASILQPSAEVAPQFTTWNIATHAGLVRQGMLVAESVEGTQTYLQQDGTRFKVKQAEIAERGAVTQSIMPNHLERLMTVQELRDMLSFLSDDSK